MSILRTFFIDFITFAKSFTPFLPLFELNLKLLLFFTENLHQTSKQAHQISLLLAKFGFYSLYLPHIFPRLWAYLWHIPLLMIWMNDLLGGRDEIFRLTYFWFDFWQHSFLFKIGFGRDIKTYWARNFSLVLYVTNLLIKNLLKFGFSWTNYSKLISRKA